MTTKKKRFMDMLSGETLELVGLHDGELLLADGDRILRFPTYESCSERGKTLTIDLGHRDMLLSVLKRNVDWYAFDVPENVYKREGYVIPEHLRTLARDYTYVRFKVDGEADDSYEIPTRVIDRLR
ncbi:MAG: hypothetical protein AAFU78_17365 [Cyanobacteria bacterium J06633_2]